MRPENGSEKQHLRVLNPQQWENQPPPVRGPGGAVTQRKGGPCKPTAVGEPAAPRERPNWGCDTEEGRGRLERRAATLQGLKGGPKRMSTAKPPEVIQRESESPSEF